MLNQRPGPRETAFQLGHEAMFRRMPTEAASQADPPRWHAVLPRNMAWTSTGSRAPVRVDASRKRMSPHLWTRTQHRSAVGLPRPPLQQARRAPVTVPAPAIDDSSRSEERVRMSRRRQTIARRLVEAQHTAAMLTTFNEVDMTAIMAIRQATARRLQGTIWRRPRIHVVLHPGGRRRAQSVSSAQCGDPGRRDDSQTVLRHRHRRGCGGGAGRPGAARCRSHVVRRRSSRVWPNSPRRPATAR